MRIVLMREGYSNKKWKLQNSWAINMIAKNSLDFYPNDKVWLVCFEWQNDVVIETRNKIIDTIWCEYLWEIWVNPYLAIMILMADYPHLHTVIILWSLKDWIKRIFDTYTEVTDQKGNVWKSLEKPLWNVELDMKLLCWRFRQLWIMAQEYEKNNNLIEI